MSRTVLLAVIGLSVASGVIAENELKDHMIEHFAVATQVQTAVINGDLEIASERAQWLANHPIDRDIPSAAMEPLATMRLHARAVGEAGTVVEAALATARMAAACGACHEQTETLTWLGTSAGEPMGESLRERMTRHLWAADRLWEGLIAPSDESWIKGAEALLEAPLTGADLGRESDAAIGEMGRALRELAEQARSATGESRALIYGEFLARCGACHQRYRAN